MRIFGVFSNACANEVGFWTGASRCKRHNVWRVVHLGRVKPRLRGRRAASGAAGAGCYLYGVRFAVHVVAAALSVALFGCASTTQLAKASCANLGLKPGSSAYVDCFERERAEREAEQDALFARAMEEWDERHRNERWPPPSARALIVPAFVP